MKAAYYTGNRSFELREGNALAPAKGEVRLEVAFCGVCGTDMHVFHGSMDKRVAPPKIIGHEASGVVAEVGEGVTGFKVGDKVAVRPLNFGAPHPFDRGVEYVGKNMKFIGLDVQGAFQSSWTVPAYALHRLPDNFDLKYGAMIEPLAVGCHDVSIGSVKAGEHCVVLGGGPIGILIAFVLRERGARALVSEINDDRLKMLESFGFETVNPARENIIEKVSSFTGEAMADVVFEVSGSAAAAGIMTEIVCVQGRIVMVAVHGEPKKVNLHRFFWSEIRMFGARLYEAADFDEAIKIAATGRIPFEQLITRIQPLEKIQELFEEIDRHPAGMKSLVDCRTL